MMGQKEKKEDAEIYNFLPLYPHTGESQSRWSR